MISGECKERDSVPHPPRLCRFQSNAFVPYCYITCIHIQIPYLQFQIPSFVLEGQARLITTIRKEFSRIIVVIR